jgi:hypothetical protein
LLVVAEVAEVVVPEAVAVQVVLEQMTQHQIQAVQQLQHKLIL